MLLFRASGTAMWERSNLDCLPGRAGSSPNEIVSFFRKKPPIVEVGACRGTHEGAGGSSCGAGFQPAVA